jgi:oligopeptide/dipeptide ABC transporter ATP-binding protein
VNTPLFQVQDLCVEYDARRQWFSKPAPVRAVNGVSLTLQHGQTYGLVGESGSGKSTVARAILQLVRPKQGRLQLHGRDVTTLLGRELLAFRRQVQAIFQDPYSSLNPSHVIADSLGEVVTRHRGIPAGAARDRAAAELLALVKLPAQLLGRFPGELSGGQRQRVAIARALAVEPQIILCDEATSALDVSVAGQIINLLEELQAQTGVAYLFISHNLGTVRHISHEIGVMYQGMLVETGPAERVFAQPAHPYTQMLLAAMAVPDPHQQRIRAHARRQYSNYEVGTPPVQGCPFQTRCPLVMDICRNITPAPVSVRSGGAVRCHAFKESG